MNLIGAWRRRQHDRELLYGPKVVLPGGPEQWIEDSLDWLIARFGVEPLRRRPVLPSAFIPAGYDGSERAARELCLKVAAWMEVPDDRIRFSFRMTEIRAAARSAAAHRLHADHPELTPISGLQATMSPAEVAALAASGYAPEIAALADRELTAEVKRTTAIQQESDPTRRTNLTRQANAIWSTPPATTSRAAWLDLRSPAQSTGSNPRPSRPNPRSTEHPAGSDSPAADLDVRSAGDPASTSSGPGRPDLRSAGGPAASDSHVAGPDVRSAGGPVGISSGADRPDLRSAASPAASDSHAAGLDMRSAGGPAGSSSGPARLDVPSAGGPAGRSWHELQSAGRQADRLEGVAGDCHDTVGAWQDGTAVMLAADTLADPAAVVAATAHELGHEVLWGYHLLERGRPDAEAMTDLFAIFHGFGIFLANQAVERVPGRRSMRQTLGYLGERGASDALAAYCFRRHQLWPETLLPMMPPELDRTVRIRTFTRLATLVKNAEIDSIQEGI